MARAGTQQCERARAWISADLDGELSELESLRLRGHLDHCESCSTFGADAGSFTFALRDASLEPLSRPLATPHRRRIAFQPLRVPAAAALVVAMIGLGGLFASLHSVAILRPASQAPVRIDDQSVRSLRLQQSRTVVAQLVARRAQGQSARIPRHPGFQSP